jgi:hypothetical protein
VLAALAALALPVALVHVPPLLDYPNHFARLWLLAGGIEQPPISAMYAVDWSVALTNIGVDLIAATLGRVIGADLLGHLLVAAALILPPLGAILLNRAVFGGWHWWQVGFPILAWNSTLLAGFLSFQIGLGLALIAASADLTFTRRIGPVGGIAARIGLCAGLLVFHVFAASFYAALLAGLAFGPDRSPFASMRLFARATLRSAMAGGFALAVPLTVFLLFAPVVPGGQAPSGVYHIWAGYTLANKIVTMISAIATYDVRVDVAFVAALWVMARIVASGALLRVHTGLLIIALGLLTMALLVPSVLGGTAFVDWRFPIMAVLTAAAALRPGIRSSRAASVVAVTLLILAVVRTAWITDIWRERQADVAAVERALSLVPAGASVLPAVNIALDVKLAPRGRYLFGGLPTYWHYPVLAIPWRHAFVPTLFTARGKQPLRVLPPWNSIAVAEGVPAPIDYLVSFRPLPALIYMFGYVADWRNRFDYLLIVNEDLSHAQGQASLPPGLELLADEGFARLYLIRRNSDDGSGGRTGTGATLGRQPGADWSIQSGVR